MTQPIVPVFPEVGPLADSLQNLCVRLLERVGERDPTTLTGLIAPTSRGIEIGLADADENLRALSAAFSTFAGDEGKRCLDQLRAPRLGAHLRVLFVSPMESIVFDCPTGMGPKEGA